MTPEALDALVASGASAEMIACAWKAEMARAEKALAERRSKDAIRKARSRDVTRCHADTEGQVVTSTDIAGPPFLDKESFPQTPFKEINPNPVSESARVRTRGSRLPDGWKPKTCDPATKAGQVIARRGQQWARETLESFDNHWRAKAGRDASKLDWQATWANWVVEQDRRDNRNGSNRQLGNGTGGRVDGFALALRRAEERTRSPDYWQSGDDG